MDGADFKRELERATPRVVRMAQRLAPTGTDAEDLVQDVFERAWAARASFRGDAAVATWLHRILVNRAADLGARARPSALDVDLLSEAQLIDVEVVDPERVVERAADAELLRAALSRLEPMDRSVLVLYDGEGWSASEIAETFAISAAATHKRLQRARLRLTRELAGEPSQPVTDISACRQARAALWDYLDDRLDEPTRQFVDSHLRDCPRCPPLIQALVGLRSTLSSSPAPAVSARLKAALERLVE